MDDLDELAKQIRREYKRKWRDANREHIKQYRREWVKQNPDKIKERDQRYWQRKALQMTQGDSVIGDAGQIPSGSFLVHRVANRLFSRATF